jgi:hypothetical protein
MEFALGFSPAYAQNSVQKLQGSPQKTLIPTLTEFVIPSKPNTKVLNIVDS